MTDLAERARAWIEGDPDPETRSEMQALLANEDYEELSSRLDRSLTFGTAGIRGRVGAGPNRMNRAVVIRTSKGLADYLITESGGPPPRPVVLGYDARPTSPTFAEDTAGVLAAAGIEVLYFPDIAPTPLVAFAAKHYDAAAAVVVTASHNPPADNGYKVYGSNAAQIIPPTDTRIAEAIDSVGPANRVPRIESVFEGGGELVRPVAADIVDSYWEAVSSARSRSRGSGLSIVYTPIHGVGDELVHEVFTRAGHTGLVSVAEQSEPDGTFPTVSFPNPEEEGVLDLAKELGVEIGADLLLANDPDADRLAVVLPTEEGWRPLTGNEIGVLLGDYVLGNHSGPPTPIVASSIVSSPMLGHIAGFRGAVHVVTLTGFKWIVNAGLALEAEGRGRFVYGYEEALGYTVGSAVRDKDGISAALIFTDMVADLADEGRSVLDRLDELWAQHGLWVSNQHSVVRPGAEGAEAIRVAIASLGDSPPGALGSYQVTGVTDYRVGAERRPPWLGAQDLIEMTLGDNGRVLVRPSGTEPKLKIYVDLRGDAGARPRQRREDLTTTARSLGEELAVALGI